MKTLIPF